MIMVIKAMAVTFFLMIVLMMLLMMISKKTITDMQKCTPFECGFNPMSYTRVSFSLHFFLIAVIFLIFDIEIIIIFPIIMMLKTSMYKYMLSVSMMFMIILTLGLYYEWYNGMLNWAS